MTGSAFELVLDDAAVLAAMDRVETALAGGSELLARIGEYGAASTTRRFETQRAPGGAAWQALSPAYASFKPAGFDILTRTGVLRSSLQYQTGAAEVRWGSDRIYAAVHQFGATIVPKNARALSFQLGLDGRRVFAKSVSIPARPYLGLDADDRAEILAITGDYLRALL